MELLISSHAHKTHKSATTSASYLTRYNSSFTPQKCLAQHLTSARAHDTAVTRHDHVNVPPKDLVHLGLEFLFIRYHKAQEKRQVHLKNMQNVHHAKCAPHVGRGGGLHGDTVMSASCLSLLLTIKCSCSQALLQALARPK